MQCGDNGGVLLSIVPYASTEGQLTSEKSEGQESLDAAAAGE